MEKLCQSEGSRKHKESKSRAEGGAAFLEITMKNEYQELLDQLLAELYAAQELLAESETAEELEYINDELERIEEDISALYDIMEEEEEESDDDDKPLGGLEWEWNQEDYDYFMGDHFEPQESDVKDYLKIPDYDIDVPIYKGLDGSVFEGAELRITLPELADAGIYIAEIGAGATYFGIIENEDGIYEVWYMPEQTGGMDSTAGETSD